MYYVLQRLRFILVPPLGTRLDCVHREATETRTISSGYPKSRQVRLHCAAAQPTQSKIKSGRNSDTGRTQRVWLIFKIKQLEWTYRGCGGVEVSQHVPSLFSCTASQILMFWHGPSWPIQTNEVTLCVRWHNSVECIFDVKISVPYQRWFLDEVVPHTVLRRVKWRVKHWVHLTRPISWTNLLWNLVFVLKPHHLSKVT